LDLVAGQVMVMAGTVRVLKREEDARASAGGAHGQVPAIRRGSGSPTTGMQDACP